MTGNESDDEGPPPPPPPSNPPSPPAPMSRRHYDQIMAAIQRLENAPHPLATIASIDVRLRDPARITQGAVHTMGISVIPSPPEQLFDASAANDPNGWARWVNDIPANMREGRLESIMQGFELAGEEEAAKAEVDRKKAEDDEEAKKKGGWDRAATVAALREFAENLLKLSPEQVDLLAAVAMQDDDARGGEGQGQIVSSGSGGDDPTEQERCDNDRRERERLDPRREEPRPIDERRLDGQPSGEGQLSIEAQPSIEEREEAVHEATAKHKADQEEARRKADQDYAEQEAAKQGADQAEATRKRPAGAKAARKKTGEKRSSDEDSLKDLAKDLTKDFSDEDSSDDETPKKGKGRGASSKKPTQKAKPTTSKQAAAKHQQIISANASKSEKEPAAKQKTQTPADPMGPPPPRRRPPPPLQSTSPPKDPEAGQDKPRAASDLLPATPSTAPARCQTRAKSEMPTPLRTLTRPSGLRKNPSPEAAKSQTDPASEPDDFVPYAKNWGMGTHEGEMPNGFDYECAIKKKARLKREQKKAETAKRTASDADVDSPSEKSAKKAKLQDPPDDSLIDQSVEAADEAPPPESIAANQSGDDDPDGDDDSSSSDDDPDNNNPDNDVPDDDVPDDDVPDDDDNDDESDNSQTAWSPNEPKDRRRRQTLKALIANDLRGHPGRQAQYDVVLGDLRALLSGVLRINGRSHEVVQAKEFEWAVDKLMEGSQVRSTGNRRMRRLWLNPAADEDDEDQALPWEYLPGFRPVDFLPPDDDGSDIDDARGTNQRRTLSEQVSNDLGNDIEVYLRKRKRRGEEDIKYENLLVELREIYEGHRTVAPEDYRRAVQKLVKEGRVQQLGVGPTRILRIPTGTTSTDGSASSGGDDGKDDDQHDGNDGSGNDDDDDNEARGPGDAHKYRDNPKEIEKFNTSRQPTKAHGRQYKFPTTWSGQDVINGKDGHEIPKSGLASGDELQDGVEGEEQKSGRPPVRQGERNSNQQQPSETSPSKATRKRKAKTEDPALVEEGNEDDSQPPKKKTKSVQKPAKSKEARVNDEMVDF